MRLGGVGGAKTTTGRDFENRRDFIALLEQVDGYRIVPGKVSRADIYFSNRLVAHSLRHYSLYRYLMTRSVDWRDALSKRLLPDEAIYVPDERLVSVIEMKYQQTAGSVDEKLQTCHFKLRQYRKLFAPLEYKVNYIYLLGDWFKKPEYSDVLDYIRDVDCHYYFDRFPLADIGLPEHELHN